MRIQFKTVRAMNFMAIGNDFLEINLEKAASTLISGKNGSGKSSIIESVFYALYNKPYRSINKPQLINSITKKNCLVELEFDIGKNQYLVRRGMNPGIFEIYKNGFLLNQDASARDYQKDFEKNIIRMPERIARQVLFLGNAGFTPFFSLPLASRRFVIEELLDIQVFSTMNNLLKDRVNQNKNAIRDNEKDLERLTEKLQILKKHEEDLKVKNDDLMRIQKSKITDLQEEIETINSSIQSHMTKVSELSSKIGDADELSDKLKKLKEYDRLYKETLKKFRKDIEFYDKNNECPTCQQDISLDFKNEEVKKRKKKSKEILDKKELLDKALESVSAKLQKIQEQQNEINGLNNKIYQANVEINSLKKRISSIEEDIAQLAIEQKKESESSNLKVVAKELKQCKESRKTLLDNRSTFEVASTLLKDTGIKTKIIKQYIPIINKLINKYLDEMDFFCEFELDENFNEQIRSRGRDNFSYHSFSEGEKARLTFALLMTWREIAKLRNSVSTNLLFLDEVFESSIDDGGSVGMVQIIENMKDSNVFIISHNEKMFDKFHSHIIMGKEKGFTKIMTGDYT